MAPTRFKNGNRKVNRLSKLNYDRRLLYSHMQSIDGDIYALTLALLKYSDLKRVNRAKTYDQMSRLNERKAKLEMKMLDIDVEISELAKSKLTEEV